MKRAEKMERAAILHIPLSAYAYAVGEYSLTIRLRAQKGDLSRCTLYAADRVCRTTPICFTAFPMTVCAEDDLYEYYEAAVELAYNRVCYYFKLEKGGEWTYYYADRFTRNLADREIEGKLIDGRSEYYQYPFILWDEIPDVPEWFKTAAVYNIFPDSFANGKRVLKRAGEHPVSENRESARAGEKAAPENRESARAAEKATSENGENARAGLGGTLHGITENLDYIQEMGFTCLYLNPIFSAGEYHRYDVLDYYHIDPRLGTEEDFRRLVDAVHRRGMRIIIDGVFNHCSWKFFAFEDVVQNGARSRYKDWFYELQYPVRRPENPDETPGYTCFAYERKMPKLNTSNREVQRYFAEVGRYWIEKYQVDGWRLDVANEVSREFWRTFRRAVKTVNPEAVLIGEVWESAPSWLRGDAFDSTMNYEFRRICTDFIAAEKPDGVRAAYAFEKMRLRYPDNLVKGQLNLLDSHDVPRFLSMCRGDLALWKLACILLFLMPGVPSLFYGDECGVQGFTESEYRRRMPWDKKETQAGFIGELARLRAKYIDGKTGYCPLWETMGEGAFAFLRTGAKGSLKVVVNAGKKAVPCSVSGEEALMMACGISLEKQELAGKGYCILALP